MATLKKVTKKTSTKRDECVVTPLFSAEDIGRMGIEYADISAQIKQLEAKKKELAEKIKNGAEQFGVKDDKGSFYLENEQFIMGKVAKKSFKIDQTVAVKTLESVGIGDVIDEVVVKTVNEDRLQRAVQEQRLSLDVVRAFTKESVSYSVLVKQKEVIPEVEQTTLKVAKMKGRK